MNTKLRFGHNGLACSALALAVLAATGGASAMQIDVGNPDIRLRWDNTVRYNLGIRAEDQDSAIMNNPNFDESDGKFDKGDIVTNRLDLLTEIDLAYKWHFGARVSAAAWYDDAYSDRTVDGNVPGYSTSYDNDRYSSEVERYVYGPSGEILDAFVWGNFDLGDTPVNVKVGKHTNYWGEGLLFGAHAISYSQAPMDAVKAVTSPGIETKEVFLPIGQVSAKAQVTNNLSISGQYFYEWDHTRMPYGGTYFGAADPFFEGPDRLAAAPGFDLRRGDSKFGRDDANWGVMARYDIQSLGATVGAYYRQFDDYQAWLSPQIDMAAGQYRLVYPRNVKLMGISYAGNVGSASIGAELSYRQDGALNATGISPITNEGPRGDTYHAVLNAVYGVPRNWLADNSVLVAELVFSHLDKVTENEEFYKGRGNAACTDLRTPGIPGSGDKEDGCSTRNYSAVAVNYTPQYLAIRPSWDLSVPLTVNYGLYGNAANAGGGSEGALAWSVGAQMTYRQKHDFTLRYADTSAQEKNTLNANGDEMVNGNGNVGGTDRGWVSLTYKTSF
ncbi:DUF1302 domain-containing protein [Pseudomonas sp. FME51]|uniref:DUF1302 domain-containing protein n=1 Tax=Pseudomonas sp. FME51 TaxID=2742609 RepID=UPI001868D206|nr:DUF1302 family protein [Pseudomonas sp. FME51]